MILDHPKMHHPRNQSLMNLQTQQQMMWQTMAWTVRSCLANTPKLVSQANGEQEAMPSSQQGLGRQAMQLDRQLQEVGQTARPMSQTRVVTEVVKA